MSYFFGRGNTLLSSMLWVKRVLKVLGVTSPSCKSKNGPPRLMPMIVRVDYEWFVVLGLFNTWV